MNILVVMSPEMSDCTINRGVGEVAAWDRRNPKKTFNSVFKKRFVYVYCVRNVVAHWWRPGGEVKGKLANGVGSQSTHTTSEGGVSNISNADAHTSAASSRLNWLPRRFKWTRLFRRKMKCGFCACAIRFHTSSTVSLRTETPSLFLCFVLLSHYTLNKSYT
jgi:hypothetical protein